MVGFRRREQQVESLLFACHGRFKRGDIMIITCSILQTQHGPHCPEGEPFITLRCRSTNLMDDSIIPRLFVFGYPVGVTASWVRAPLPLFTKHGFTLVVDAAETLQKSTLLRGPPGTNNFLFHTFFVGASSGSPNCQLGRGGRDSERASKFNDSHANNTPLVHVHTQGRKMSLNVICIETVA